MIGNYTTRSLPSFSLRSILHRYFLFFAAILLCGSTHAQSWQFVGPEGFSDSTASYPALAADAAGNLYMAFSDRGSSSAISALKFDGTAWSSIGTGFSPGPALYTSLTIDKTGTPLVAFRDEANANGATVMKYTGSAWLVVGIPGFSSSEIGTIQLTADTAGTPWVAFADFSLGYRATVMKYNSSTTGWDTVGPRGFSAGSAMGINIAIDKSGTPYVNFVDRGAGQSCVVMKYNGSSWVNIAPPIDTGATSTCLALDNNGTPGVFYEFGYDSGYVVKYNGSGWTPLGSSALFSSFIYYNQLAFDRQNKPYVAYIDLNNSRRLTVVTYNGTAWDSVGTTGFTPSAIPTYPSMVLDNGNTPLVGFYDNAVNGKTTVMRPGTWASVKNTAPATQGVSVYPNPAHGTFTIRVAATVAAPDAQVVITNVLGEKIKEFQIPVNKTIDVDVYTPPGLYFITAVTGAVLHTAQLVIE